VSIRSIERLEDVNKETILHMLNVAGVRCTEVLEKYIVNVPVEQVEADEVWGFVAKKEGHKTEAEQDNDKIGDAYTFVAIEAKSKLVVCYQLGRRDIATALKFTEKLQRASDGRFQLSTDGLRAYLEAVEQTFGADIDYAMLIKKYKSDEAGNLDRRYSPGDFVGATKHVVTGNPDLDKVGTSYVERNNLTIRMSTRRLTRLTNAFSKKWDNFDMALALHFAYYNFCKVHGSLRVTPAMEAGITDHIWSWDELIGADFGIVTAK
jgi:IS1 family transposase